MLVCLPGPWPPLLRPVPAAQRGEGAPSESPPGSAASLPGRRCPPPLPEVWGAEERGDPTPVISGRRGRGAALAGRAGAAWPVSLQLGSQFRAPETQVRPATKRCTQRDEK